MIFVNSCLIFIRTLCVFFILAGFSYANNDATSLRESMHKDCLSSTGEPFNTNECLNRGADFVIYKTKTEPYHYLFIPITDIEGVESPLFWQEGYPSWFTMAWRHRYLAAPNLGRKGVDINNVGIAINSKYARTQNQLHIHINCIRPDVSLVLRKIDPSKIQGRVDLLGISYEMLRFPGTDLPDWAISKFNSKEDFAKQTLFAALINNSVIVLSSQFVEGKANSGSAEDLLTNCQ